MIDSERIFNAILASGVTSPKSIETGSELVDSWVEQCQETDKKYRTLGLEVGWFIALDERTFVVGAVDKLVVEPNTIDVDDGVVSGVRHKSDPFVFERKTTSASKTWTAEKWFEDLRGGSQVATYAAALKWGTFIQKETITGTPSLTSSFSAERTRETCYAVASPRVLARAITKTKPPMIWPTPDGAWIDFTDARLDAQMNAYRSEAAALHTRRRLGLVPWQTPGFQCTLTFGFTKRPCSAWNTCHETLEFPVTDGRVRPLGLSPGSQTVVDHLITTGRIPLDNAGDVVVLSASSMKSAQQCSELWRQESIGATRQDDNEAMDTGTVLHAGMKSFDEQMKEAGY